MHILPILSTLVTFVFAFAVLARYRYKKPLHLLFWGLGLVLYGIGTGSEVALSIGYHNLVLRLWYLTGAMLTAAWLGQGTVYLLVRRQGIAHALAAGLLLISALAALLILLAPITPAAAGFDVSVPVSTQYKAILVRSGLVTVLTIVLNIYGTLTLVGGAIYSAFLFWRKSILASRMVGNLFIAGGALLPATAGAFIQAGLADWLYLSELLGASLMFVGFLFATRSKNPVWKPQPAEAG